MDPWAAVVGQTEALTRLEQAASNPVHAYLLLGRRGYGTHQAALGFAGLVLAASIDTDDDAGRERALSLALDANHPDLMVFRPEGAALRVSEAEEIIRAGLRTPLEGWRKVIVVDGIDTTIPLFHALLQEPDIHSGDYNIHWLERWLETNLGDA